MRFFTVSAVCCSVQCERVRRHCLLQGVQSTTIVIRIVDAPLFFKNKERRNYTRRRVLGRPIPCCSAWRPPKETLGTRTHHRADPLQHKYRRVAPPQTHTKATHRISEKSPLACASKFLPSSPGLKRACRTTQVGSIDRSHGALQGSLRKQ
jgi:hypothetical protein